MDKKELIKNFNFALKAQKEGKNLEAIKFFEKIIKVEPNHFETNFFLGNLYIQNDNFKHAIKFLSKAQSLNPKIPDIHNNLGRIYLRPWTGNVRWAQSISRGTNMAFACNFFVLFL